MSAGTGAAALHGMWSYHSSLVAYQQANSSVWFVAWQPSVMGPNLTAKTHLAAVQVPPKVSMVADSAGGNLTSYNDPGLTNISGLLMKAAPPGQGKPGLDVEIQTTAGAPVKNSQAVILDPENVQSIATTISSTAEAAAQTAVGMHNESSMVVIQPSTGKILAIANNDGFNDFALTSDVSPGSTMKVITSTALLNAGVLTPTSPVACPKTFTVQGTTFHNDQNETEPATTPFMTDFAQSCNNAFTSQYEHLSGALASTAKEYYGLDQKWDIGISGISASYFNAPADASGSELAQEAFGQGALQASPLAMASVAATVDTGTFEQPILVPGTKQVTATALPAATDDRPQGDDARGRDQRHGRRPRLRPDRLREDRDRRHPEPGQAQQLARRLRLRPGHRGRLPGPRRGLRRPVRGPRGAELPQPLLTAAPRPGRASHHGPGMTWIAAALATARSGPPAA